MQLSPSTSGPGGVLFQALQGVARAIEPSEAAAQASARSDGASRLPDQATLAAAESAGESGRPAARGSFVNLSV